MVNLAIQSTSNPSAPCHSEGSVRESSFHMHNTPQVMSPNVEQNPPQDSTSAHEPPSEDATQRPKKRERKEEDPTPKSEQEQFDVKEESGEDFPPIRSSDPMHTPYQQDTSAGTDEAPLLWAMGELRSAQHDLEILRNRVDGVAALCDMRELREGQEALSTRVRSVE